MKNHALATAATRIANATTVRDAPRTDWRETKNPTAGRRGDSIFLLAINIRSC
jgi:hypothetical protein